MKKILLTLCAVILAVTLQAQEHMAFKGVSMGCNITSFVSQLKTKGFTVEYQADNGVILKGNIIIIRRRGINLSVFRNS